MTLTSVSPSPLNGMNGRVADMSARLIHATMKPQDAKCSIVSRFCMSSQMLEAPWFHTISG